MKVWTYTVSGFGRFPLDMLRYDCVYPATGADVKEIVDSSGVGAGRDFHIIKLESHRPPTPARWDSFSWAVEGLAVTKR